MSETIPIPEPLTANTLPDDHFFSSKLKVATAEICAAPWSGGKNGAYFRCHFCGHKFIVGDHYRILFTNDMKGAGGNPIVCEKCNDSTENLRAKWKDRNDQWRFAMNAPENWAFRKRYEHT